MAFVEEIKILIQQRIFSIYPPGGFPEIDLLPPPAKLLHPLARLTAMSWLRNLPKDQLNALQNNLLRTAAINHDSATFGEMCLLRELFHDKMLLIAVLLAKCPLTSI